MAFLTIEQMKSHIYPGVSNAISNNDTSLLQDAIDAAIGEAKGYCSRYDLALLFDSAVTPDPMLLNWVKSIAKWNFMNLANPNIDYEDAHNRYELVTAKLRDIQSGKMIPANWPLASPKERSNLFHVGSSSKKRNNHFGSLNTFDPFNNNY